MPFLRCATDLNEGAVCLIRRSLGAPAFGAKGAALAMPGPIRCQFGGLANGYWFEGGRRWRRQCDDGAVALDIGVGVGAKHQRRGQKWQQN